MTKIPTDDIMEGLYKLRIRESEKLKTVLELYDLENHQKKIGPDYHRLKTMVKISVPTLLVVHSVEGGVRTQLQFLFKFCKLNVQSLHGVSFAVVFVSTSLIW